MPRAGLSPERLTLAAAELADREGLHAVTATALARHFGVAPASLYSHVRGTLDLRERVALLGLQESADALADVLAGRSGRAALAALAAGYRDYATAHPGRWAATRTRLDPAAAATSAGPRHAALARAALGAYGLDEPDLTHAVRIVGALVQGWIELETAGSFDHSDPPAAASRERLVDALDAMFRAWPATPHPTTTPQTEDHTP
ncbi:TetR/AcrR family transcriptional regulator [Nostocoides sp. Soil756]|uniref:TetR/AcrR family transcriptional regulator n=1 Tax=Nostocoides sp. Soil756 TaxID=1736399 RepID=UPI0006FDCBBB|nr:TetR/AcrR family transcriptional regulator [Tetrasphaera sp. Soil756]KRE60162.1 TetR family transcriptional regulator [Tetrasphaera sp. Soil756]